MAIQRVDYQFIYHKVGGHEVIFEISDEDLAGDPQYFGYLSANGAWLIQERNVASGTYRYAMGLGSTISYKTAITGAWADRAGLTYVYYDAL
jgi:hypothetical protein